MLSEDYRSPSVRTIAMAGIAFLILLVAFWFLSDVVKAIGWPLLYLPDKIGIVQQVKLDEAHVIASATAATQLEFPKSGRYAVYTADRQLLIDTDKLLGAHEKPWLIVEAGTTSERLSLSFVERGLRPYDTPVVRGRPIFTFEIVTPGNYMIANPPRDGTIAIVPDYTTGKETTIFLAYLTQIGNATG